MRVLLVTHRFPPEGKAGVERYTARLASALASRGHQVAVVTRVQDSTAPLIRLEKSSVADGVTLYSLAGPLHSLDRFLTHAARVDLLYRRVLSEFGPDLVHINHLIFLSPDLVRLSHSHGAAVMLTLHDFYFACPLAHLRKVDGSACRGPNGGEECAATCFRGEDDDRFLRWAGRTQLFASLLQAADVTVAPSEFVRTFFVRSGVAKDAIRIIPHGLPETPGRASYSAKAGGPLRLAYIGTVTPHKGVHLIVEAIGKAAIGRSELRIIGDSRDETYRCAIRAAASLLPELRVLFEGSYEPLDLSTILADTDLVIVPSAAPETFSFTVREALSCGIPVLVASAGALPEAVQSGVNGFIFGDGNELATLLRSLASDPALLAQLREGAAATRLPSFDDHVERLEREYLAALATSRESAQRAARNREISQLRKRLTPISTAW